MSNEFDEDEFEEIEEDDEKEKLTTITDEEKPTVIEEPYPEPVQTQRPNNLYLINKQRNISKKVNAIRYFIHFGNNPNKTYDQAAIELGLSKSVAEKYLKEYAVIASASINNKTYPDGVLVHYNDFSIPKEQRLTVQHVQAMKPILLRYHKINVDSALGQEEEEEEEEENSSNNPLIDEIINDEPIIEGAYKNYNQYKQQTAVANTNPKTINENSPIQDVIEFGIINAGQPDQAKIRRIKTLFVSAPAYYLTDEARFIELLESNEIKPKTLATFMNWFKNIAPIHPTQRLGFLNLTNNGGGMTAAIPHTGAKMPIKHFDINDYDDFAQFLYHEGVFQYGLPPEHRTNQESYKRYQAKKRQEEDDQDMARQISLATKKWMVDLQMRGMGGGVGMNGGGGGGPQFQPGTMYDERYLFERGVVAPEITYDENGKRITRWIPTGKPLYGDQSQVQGPPKDNFTESIGTFTRLIEAIKPILQTNNGGGTMNPMMDKLLTVTIEKIMNKAEESPSKMLENQMGLFNQFKTFFPSNENKAIDPTTASLQLELAKIANDAKIADKTIDIQERHFQFEQELKAEQKNESKDNIGMIMEWITKGFGYIQPLLAQILTGQVGGGLNTMIPGADGGMMMPPPQTPYGNGSSPYIPQNGGFIDPAATNEQMEIPREFLPNEQPYYEEPPPPPPPPPPQQYIPQQPPQQYIPPQPQPQPYIETSPQEYYLSPEPELIPPPPPKNENDFLNNITMNDLNTLTINQLNDVESRLQTKMNKLEKIRNSIKSTKTKKQFGYNTKKKPIDEDYRVLDVPREYPDDYDGLEGVEIDPSTQRPDITYTKPSLSPNDNEPEFEWVDYNYNNTIMDIQDMDNQQFNQTNNANSREFIEAQEKIQAKKAQQAKLETLRARGINVDENELHLYNEVTGEKKNPEVLKDPASAHNTADLNINKEYLSEKESKDIKKHGEQSNKKQEQFTKDNTTNLKDASENKKDEKKEDKHDEVKKEDNKHHDEIKKETTTPSATLKTPETTSEFFTTTTNNGKKKNK